MTSDNLKSILALDTADLSLSRQKRLQLSFLFGDLLQRSRSRVSPEELHRLALECHFSDQQ